MAKIKNHSLINRSVYYKWYSQGQSLGFGLNSGRQMHVGHGTVKAVKPREEITQKSRFMRKNLIIRHFVNELVIETETDSVAKTLNRAIGASEPLERFITRDEDEVWVED